MTTFDDRERDFENRFAHDEQMAFRAQARRDHEIGLWAAHQLGKSGDAAEAYASSILMLSIETGDVDAVATRLHDDLNRHGVHVSDHQIRRRMDELLAQAVGRIRGE